jgi:hypothetical protein
MSATTINLTTTQIINNYDLKARTTASLIGSQQDLERSIRGINNINTPAGLKFYQETTELYRAVTRVLRSRGYEN